MAVEEEEEEEEEEEVEEQDERKLVQDLEESRSDDTSYMMRYIEASVGG